mgnify:CR=1 FL=1
MVVSGVLCVGAHTQAALGVAGTFLGDYFGILQTQMITSFPFNVVANPMYVGSSLCYLGHALFAGSPTGIVIAGVVYLCYKVALAFEGCVIMIAPKNHGLPSLSLYDDEWMSESVFVWCTISAFTARSSGIVNEISILFSVVLVSC